QARRHPLHRDQGRLRREPDVADRTADERPVPGDRRGARARAGQGLRPRRGAGGVPGRRDALRAAPAAPPPARARPLLRLRHAASRRRGPPAAAAARAQGAAAQGAPLRGPDPLQPAPERRARRGALPRGVPEGARGRDRQESRQPVHREALARLAEAEVPRRAGARDRRLHRAEGVAHRLRRPARRIQRERRAALRREGGHRLRPRGAERAGRQAARARDGPVALPALQARSTGHALGAPGARRADRLLGVDARRAAAASTLPGTARGQAGARGRARGAVVRSVEITHPDKLLFPDDGISKGALAGYYERVSEWMLPHIRYRPISMQRFPDGIGGKGFFHKDIPDYFPGWLRRAEVPKSGGTVTHVYACDADTLVYLVGQNTITPHVWLSRVDRLWQPDRMVIDLDPPPGSDFTAVRRAARHSAE